MIEFPKQKIKFTQWFYTDCLMDYYGTEAFSDEHFEIIETTYQGEWVSITARKVK